MIKYAITDGNWSSTSTWNDNTIPVDGDKVYCNGHVITLDNSMIVNNAITLFSEDSDSEIRNDANDDYSIVQGGYVYYLKNNTSVTVKINANLICDYDYLLYVAHAISNAVNVYVTDIYTKSGTCVYNVANGTTTVNNSCQITLHVNSLIIDNGKAVTAYAGTLYDCKSIISHSTEPVFNLTSGLSCHITCKGINIILDNNGILGPNGITFTDEGNEIDTLSLSNSSHLAKNGLSYGGRTIRNLIISDSSTLFTETSSQAFSLNIYNLTLVNINNTLAPSYSTDTPLFYRGGTVNLGNISGNGTGILIRNADDITITGNINLDGTIIICKNSNSSVNIHCSSITYNGIFPFDTTFATDLTPNGINVVYTGSNDPDFFIVGKGNMNDDTNYPAEADVKKGVSYACGAKTGTMESGGGVSPDTDNMIRRILGYVVRIYNRKFRNN